MDLDTDRGDYARLERLRKYADNQAQLYDTDCEKGLNSKSDSHSPGLE